MLSTVGIFKPSISVTYELQDLCCSTTSEKSLTPSSEKVKFIANMNRFRKDKTKINYTVIIFEIKTVSMSYDEAMN